MISNKEIVKRSHVLTVNSTKCSCGHTLPMPANMDKMLCNWCGNYVFRTKELEFKYRLKEQMNKKK